MDILTILHKFFVILLPGTIGMLLYNKINVHKEQHYYFEFLKIITYSFFSFMVVDLVFAMIKHMFPCFIWAPTNILTQIGSDSVFIPEENVIAAIIVAVIIASFVTKMNYDNWLFKVANKLHLTYKLDNQPVWEHIFDEVDVVVLRDYITKNTYYGKVVSYSDNSDIREICFKDVYVYNENSDFLYHATKLYLSRGYNEFSIEVQDEADQLNMKGAKDYGKE